MVVARDKIEDLEGKINIKMLCKTLGKVYNKNVKCYERREYFLLLIHLFFAHQSCR